MREAIRNMSEEDKQTYYNPSEQLRYQRAESYRRNVYELIEKGDPIAVQLFGEYTQCDHTLQYLKYYASITPLEALNAFGCNRLAARISDLRADGYDIRTELNRGKKNYAIYRLEED